MNVRLALSASLMAALFSGTSGAAGLDAQQALQQFNLVTLGNANMQSHVDGRSFIGGALTGNSVFAMHPADMPASSYAGLTVAGNASNLQVTAGGATILGNLDNAAVNNGPAVVAGNASNSNFNGTGGSYVGGTRTNVNANSGDLSAADAASAISVAQSTDFASVLNTLSDNLSTLASTGSFWSISGGRVTFHAVADSNGLAVFDISSADETLLGSAEFDFDMGGATTVIFNSDVTSASIHANFIGGGAQTIATRTIWNFYNATTLEFQSQFGGNVLATEAALTNDNNVEGGVFVSSLIQKGEIHEQQFSGHIPGFGAPVPEPSSLLMMLLGMVTLLVLRARRPQAVSKALSA
jgi:choice-of-anchor A domain-containing protein